MKHLLIVPSQYLKTSLLKIKKTGIYYIHNKRPLGLQKITNQILEKSKGKYIIRVDPDDWLDESALLYCLIKSNPILDVI